MVIGGVHMTDRRRTYTKEFKLEAIQLVESQGGNASAVARNLGIKPNLLTRWIREYKADQKHAFPGLGTLKEPEEELRQLRKELADTKMERDILKKALGIFSKPPH
jgi:transposase